MACFVICVIKRKRRREREKEKTFLRNLNWTWREREIEKWIFFQGTWATSSTGCVFAENFKNNQAKKDSSLYNAADRFIAMRLVMYCRKKGGWGHLLAVCLEACGAHCTYATNWQTNSRIKGERKREKKERNFVKQRGQVWFIAQAFFLSPGFFVSSSSKARLSQHYQVADISFL